jgi:hypothetical protein
MKPKLPWHVIRFVWQLHFVETRLFCREVGIDRSWLQDKIAKEGWQAENAATLAQMKAMLLVERTSKNIPRAEIIERNIRIRRTAWALAAKMLRLMMDKE